MSPAPAPAPAADATSRGGGLRRRVLLPVAVGAVAIAGVAGIGWTGQHRLADTGVELLRDSTVLANHLNGDMMHDAIRADVLAALLAEPADLPAIRTGLDVHAATFLQMQDENRGLMTDPALLSALATARPDLEAYVGQARQLVGLAGEPARAKAALPAFVAAFDALAEDQEALTTLIEDHNTATERASEAEARRSDRLLLVVGLIALAVMVGAGLRTAQGVLRPVGRLHRRLTLLGRGDLSEPAETWGRDELGEMGRALETAQSSLAGTVRTITGSAQSLSAASEQLSQTAAAIAASADETSTQSDVVAAAADEVSRSVSIVATGSTELGAAIDRKSTRLNSSH